MFALGMLNAKTDAMGNCARHPNHPRFLSVEPCFAAAFDAS